MYYVSLMNIIKAKFTNVIAAVALSIDSCRVHENGLFIRPS